MVGGGRRGGQWGVVGGGRRGGQWGGVGGGRRGGSAMYSRAEFTHTIFEVSLSLTYFVMHVSIDLALLLLILLLIK